MASVSSTTDGGYSYLKPRLEELEKEYQEEIQRAKEREAKGISNLESKQEAELKRRDQKFSETIKDIRSRGEDAFERSQENTQQEIQRLKAQLYDQRGRYNGEEADVLKRKLADLKGATDAKSIADEKKLNLLEENLIRKAEQLEKNQQSQLDFVTEQTKDQSKKSYEEQSATMASVYKDQKDLAGKNFENLNQQRFDEQQALKNSYEKVNLENRKNLEWQLQKIEEKRARDAELTNKNFNLAFEEKARNLKSSHDNQVQNLSNQNKELSEANSRYWSSKGEGTAEAIKEFENEARHREQKIAGAYTGEIEVLKQREKENEKYLARLNNEKLKEQDAKFSNLIKEINQDHFANSKYLESEFNKGRQLTEKQAKESIDRSDRVHETQIAKAEENRTQQLEDQSVVFQKSSLNEKARRDGEIKTLEKEIQARKTSQDIGLISPAAEAALRKTLDELYGEKFDVERNRHSLSEDSIQSNYGKRLSDLVVDTQMKETSLRRQFAIDQETSRGALTNFIREMEITKDESVRQKEYENEKNIDLLKRNYTSIMERQRRGYEDLLTSSQQDAQLKLTTILQDTDFNLKMTQKAFAVKQNELIRDSGKKLLEQKVEFETRIDDLKRQNDVALREKERNSKQLIEEQSKGFERRVAQLESQYKEREKTIHENYQDQIEKIRQSNALLHKKS